MDDEFKPPRIFTTVTSSAVQYNMDFVSYLISQEIDRRKISAEPAMSSFEVQEFQRDLIRTLILRGDADSAIQLRPKTTRKQLNG